MMSKKEFLASEKECASMLGKNLKQYRSEVKEVRIQKTSDESRNYDNSILSKLGLDKSILKSRRVI